MQDIGYARVSTADQDPQLQLDALDKAGCWPIYTEEASGIAKKRPVRDQTLGELNRGDRLTVWKLDRLGRSLMELQTIITDLDHRTVRFRSLTEHIDTSTAQGRLFFMLLAAFAEFERAMLIERTKAGRAAAKAAGKPLGGRRLYGTVGTGKDAVTPEQAAAEADRLREAARHVLDGGSLGRLVDAWNRAKVPTATGKGRWSETPARRMLLNPLVAPLVDRDQPGTHDRLVRLFAPTEQRKHLGAPAVHLLGGILRCGICEQPMYSGTHHGNRIYRCRRTEGSGGRHTGCGGMSVSMPRADDWAMEAFVAAVCAEEFTDSLNRRRAELLAGEVTAAQVEEWRQEIGELEQVLPTRFSTDVHRRRHDELQRLVRQATAQLLQRPDLRALGDLPRSEAKLRARWDGWTIPERRTWLRRVLSHVTCNPATGTGRASDVAARLDPHWKR